MLGMIGTGAWVQAATDVPAELKDYTKIGPEAFGITEEMVHTYTAGDESVWDAKFASDGTSFEKSYLEADVSFTDCENIVNVIRYLGTQLFLIDVGYGNFRVYSELTGDVLYAAPLSGLEGTAGEYFNLKFATDIVDNKNDSTKSDITVKIWINNNLVSPQEVNKDYLKSDMNAKSVTFTVADTAITRNLTVSMIQEGTIKIKPHVEAEQQDPLAGYQKIGAEDFGITEGKLYATGSETSTEYIEGVYQTNKLYFDNKYIEADVSITGEQGNLNSIQPIGGGIFMIYVSWNTFYVYSEKAATVLYQVPMSDLGNVGANGEYFNLKFATDVVDNATDPDKTDITVKIWVNDNIATPNTLDTAVVKSDMNAKSVTMTVDDTAITNTLSVGMYGSEGIIKIKPCVEDGPAEPQDPLEGYTKISPEMFGIAEEKVYATGSETSTEYIEGVEATDKTYFNKKYLEAEIAMTGDGGNANSIQPIGGGIFMIYVSWGNFYIYSEKTAQVLYEAPLSELGGVGANGDYINLKLATDIVENADNSENVDITVRVWVNDNLVEPNVGDDTDSVTITVAAQDISNTLSVGMYGDAGEIKIRPVSPLAGYTRIGLEAFGITEEITHTFEGTDIEENYYVQNTTDFHKTYLDVDVSLTPTSIESAFGYLNPNLIRVYITGTTLAVYSLEGATLMYQTELDDLEISAGEYFNLKLATDIVDNADDTKSDVKVKMWINNTLVTPINDTVTVPDNYVGSWLNVTLKQEGTIKLKPQGYQEPSNPDGPQEPENPEEPENPDVKEVLKDYVRVIPDSFAIVDGNFKHGWTEGNWMGYEYPESLNHTYLDADISLCRDDTFNNAIRYLSKNGWESLLIGISGENFQVYETTTNTLIYQISLTEAGIKADEFFNLKLSTDISGDTMTLSLWIEDTLIRTTTGEAFAVVEGCSAIGNMLGVYLPYEGTIRIKTPETGGEEDKKPNKTEQPNANFKELTFGSFAVWDGKYGYIGTELATKGTYILSVNETVFSGDFHFSQEAGADFRYGGKNNPWNGLRFWTTGDGKLYMQDATQKTEIYAFHPLYAGVQLVDNTFNMKLSIEFVDSDNDGRKDDVKLGVWFNDVLYRNEYIYLTDYASQLGNACSVYVMNRDSWLQIASDKNVYTGVDFTLFGFTKNWKKELGIK